MDEPSSDRRNERDASVTASLAQLDALVRLLGDEDENVLRVVWDELERLGTAALPALREARREHCDERVRVQAERFLREWHRRGVFREWVQFCRRGRWDLEEGSFLVARSERPDCDVGACAARLDEHANTLRRRVEAAPTPDAAVTKVTQYLFDELGFTGNSTRYDDPDNSYLDRVLERKIGIPISLSAVVLLVCRRLALRVTGVGTPGHFLLKFRGASGERFVDAFHGGRILDTRECARLLATVGVQLESRHLRAVDDQTILIRMLNNLFKVYWDAGDTRRSNRVAAMAKLLSSEAGD